MNIKALALLATLLPITTLAMADNQAMACMHQPMGSNYSTQFVSTQEVPITQAKIDITANATVTPDQLSVFMSSLSKLQDAQNNKLVLKTVNQNKTDSGMVNVVATLEDVVPITATEVAYQFASKHSGAGVTYSVASINPYLSVDAQDSAKHVLELKLYQAAQQFAQTLNKTSGQTFSIRDFNTVGYQDGAPMPRPMYMMSRMAAPMGAMMTSAGDAGGNGLAVSQTLTLTAYVTYHAN